MTLYLSVRAILHRELFPGKLIKFQSAWKQSYNSAIETRVYHKTKQTLYAHYVYRESRIVCCGSQGSKGYQKSWVKTCATSGSGTGTGNAFHSLLITTMGESRQSAIGCNRKNMLTHSPQKPQSTNPSSPRSLPLPLALSLLSTDAIIDLICNCFMSGKIRVSICMTNSQCNLPIKLDGCPTVSLFLSFLSLPLQFLYITV